MLDRMPGSNPSSPVLQKRMTDDHSLSVYAPHHAAPVDEYQVDPHNDDGQGPMLEQGVVPGGGSGQHEWVHTHQGEPVNGGHANSANEAMMAAEKSHADLTGGWDPSEILGNARGRRALIELEHDNNDEDWDRWNEHARVEEDPRRNGSRRQAWSGWGPSLVEDHHHKVAGFEWDQHLNGYVSRVANPKIFECSCGAKHPVPSYSNCKCGKIWNSYVIGTGGDRHEASADTFIAREIPRRENVIVANRKLAAEPPFDPRYWLRKADNSFMGYWLARQRKTALEMEDLRFPKRSGYDLDNEVEDAVPFPSEHHPKAGEATMKAQPDDWYARGKGNKWVPGVAGPHQFKKKRTDS